MTDRFRCWLDEVEEKLKDVFTTTGKSAPFVESVRGSPDLISSSPCSTDRKSQNSKNFSIPSQTTDIVSTKAEFGSVYSPYPSISTNVGSSPGITEQCDTTSPITPSNEDDLACVLTDVALKTAICDLSDTNRLNATESTAQVNETGLEGASLTSTEPPVEGGGPPPSVNGDQEPAVHPIHLLCSDCSSGASEQRFSEPYLDRDKEGSEAFTRSPDTSPTQPVKLLRRVSTKELMARSELIDQLLSTVDKSLDQITSDLSSEGKVSTSVTEEVVTKEANKLVCGESTDDESTNSNWENDSLALSSASPPCLRQRLSEESGERDPDEMGNERKYPRRRDRSGCTVKFSDTERKQSISTSTSCSVRDGNFLLIDQEFCEDTPTPVNFADKILHGVRHRTSRMTSDITDSLENYDSENDPSLAQDGPSSEEGQPIIPEIKCDVAIRLSRRAPPQVISWFVAELRGAGLIVGEQQGCSGDVFLKVTADRELFLTGAEALELQKRVLPNEGLSCFKPFTRHEAHMFIPRQSSDGFLSAAERQLIVYNSLNSLRVETAICLSKVKFYQNQNVISKLISANIVKQIYPLHQKSKQTVLNRIWVWNLFREQPLALIRQYFGDDVAIYFAWLGFYTTILIIPLLVGSAICLVYDEKDVEAGDRCFTFYALFNVIWPTLFLELWKRRSAELAWEWGNLGRDIESRDNQRPAFYGTLGPNPVTEQVEMQYPEYKRQIKQVVSLVISVLCLLVVLVSMLAVFRFDDYVVAMIKDGVFPYYVPHFLTRFLKYTPKIALALTVGSLDVIYSNIAVTLNNWENYKHHRTYENRLVLKLILFKFVNSFLALFYIAFYLQNFVKLQDTLAALLITKPIINNFGEIFGPKLTSWGKVFLLRRRRETDNDTSKLTQVETESEKPEYSSSFDDYLEMFIQMGYVILFSAAYPQAAVWAFLNNLVEIRGDAFKLVNGVQRPFMKRVEDIGFWQEAFEVLSVISIMVNCALIGMRGQVGRWFPSFSAGQQMLFVIFLEHVFIAIKLTISIAIPDVPARVALAAAQSKYRREKVLKGLEALMTTTKMKSNARKHVKHVRERLRGGDKREKEL